MTDTIFTKEVLLDISVNIIPLAILGVFLSLFVTMAPWGIGLELASLLQILLIGSMFIGLALLTFFAARRIETE